MGKCNIDHSVKDVKQKLDEQYEYLPQDLAKNVKQFLHQDLTQETLNEVFHLLKKYDLATEAEREVRIKQFEQVIKK